MKRDWCCVTATTKTAAAPHCDIAPGIVFAGLHARRLAGSGLHSYTMPGAMSQCGAAAVFVVAVTQHQSRFIYIAQKAYYDMNHTDAKFQVGDQVLLSTKHLRFKNPGSPKLLPLYIGPMPITAKINEVAYRVKLPDGFKIHDVFHVSKLKLHRDGPGMILPPPPLDLGDGQWFLVERILKHRTVKGRVEYLVRWAGYGPEHDLWEPAKNISKDLIKEYKGTLIPTPEII
ncbi:hypothetical protein QJQ45_002387 [Haematococcus lacustris]|nr:hypothetical protein QJQ45_002387 [Haematococcus lacustris]